MFAPHGGLSCESPPRRYTPPRATQISEQPYASRNVHAPSAAGGDPLQLPCSIPGGVLKIDMLEIHG